MYDEDDDEKNYPYVFWPNTAMVWLDYSQIVCEDWSAIIKSKSRQEFQYSNTVICETLQAQLHLLQYY